MDDKVMKSVCDATDRVVSNVTPSQFELATPCTDWNVRQLANHLLGTLHLGRALLTDTTPDVTLEPGGAPAEDLIGQDLIGAYRTAAAALVAATTPDAVNRLHVTPLGEMPGAGLAGFAALDVLVHGWDLAKATGQATNIDASLAELFLGFARQSISDEMGTRAPRIGPEIACPADADPTTRLVAYLGRQP